MKKLLVALGLITLMVFGVGSVAAISPDVVENNYITEEQAYEHANVALLEFILSGSPGLNGTDWSGTTLDPNPLILNDFSGLKLFYEFSVIKSGSTVGQIKIGASKVLGISPITIELTPKTWSEKSVTTRAQEIIHQKFPNDSIVSTNFLVYSYPRIGALMKVEDPVSKNLKTVIVDITLWNLIEENEFKEKVSSFYENIPDNELQIKLKNWNTRKEFVDKVKNLAKSKNIDLSNVLSPSEIAIMKDMLGDPSVLLTEKILSLHHHYQETEYWCVPATGQMIGHYYGYSTHTQSQIASWMSTTPDGTPIGNSTYGELHYHRVHISKPQSVASMPPLWSDAVAEINANRPFDSRIVDGFSHHARAIAGYGYTIDGFPRWFVYDPWSGIHWETYGSIPLYINIYVR